MPLTKCYCAEIFLGNYQAKFDVEDVKKLLDVVNKQGQSIDDEAEKAVRKLGN